MSNETVSTAPPTLPNVAWSWRSAVLIGILLAHLGGAALILAGDWIIGLVVIIASHLVFFWGAVVPGSKLYGPVLERMNTPHREVWLTIDDGPSGDSQDMLNVLDEYNAKATFFVVGERAQKRPDALRAIVDRGHEIGNHTLSHPSAGFWMTLPRTMRREIGAAQELLESLSGGRPRWFRAVAGMANPFVHPELKRHGLRLIGWSARGFDTVEGDPDKVVSRILRRLKPGAILMLHEGCRHGASVATLKRLLEALDQRGYRCVLPAARPESASC